MLADAFEALKTFDWGTNLEVLSPIEDAVIAPAVFVVADQPPVGIG